MFFRKLRNYPWRAAVVVLLVFSTVEVYAQINESDTSKYEIKIGINGIVQKGNVDLIILRSRVEWMADLGKNFVVKSQSNTLYQSFSGWKADQDLNSRNFLYYSPRERLYPFAMAFVQTNFRRKLGFRYFSGLGVSYSIVQRENMYVKVSGSMVREESRFDAQKYSEPWYDGADQIRIWRPTSYVAVGLGGRDQKIHFHGSASWQPGLDPVSNQRFQGEATVEIKVAKGFALTLQYLYSYEGVVPLSVQKSDSIFSFGGNYRIRK